MLKKDRKRVPPDLVPFCSFSRADPEAEFFLDERKPIPTPSRTEVKSRVPVDFGSFSLPQHYVKFQIETGAKLITDYDHYDLLKEDLDWLTDYNSKLQFKHQLTELQLENLIDCFEKESFKVTGHVIDPSNHSLPFHLFERRSVCLVFQSSALSLYLCKWYFSD
jgi:hypothetical protein